MEMTAAERHFEKPVRSKLKRTVPIGRTAVGARREAGQFDKAFSPPIN